MLDIVRKHSSSWIVNLLLFLIVLVFIFFFGSSAIRSNVTHSGNTEATVDGEPITTKTVNGLFALQQESNPSLKNLPEPLVKQVRSQVLNEVIESKVSENAATKMGIRVSNEELAHSIRQTGGLNGTGKFDQKYYVEEFLPAYRDNYGLNFEDFMRQSLIQEKLKNLFVNSVVISDAAVRERFNAENNRVTLKVVHIPSGAFTKAFTPDAAALAKEIELQKQAGRSEEDAKKFAEHTLKETEGAKRAKALSDEYWPQFTQDKLTKAALDKNKLTEQEFKNISLGDSTSIMGRPLTLEESQSIFNLSETKRFPDKPIESGGSYYFIKLVSKTQASPEEFEKAKGTLKAEMQNQIAGQTYSRWYSAEAQKAKIEIN